MQNLFYTYMKIKSNKRYILRAVIEIEQ